MNDTLTHIFASPISPTTASTQSLYTPITPGAEKGSSAFDLKIGTVQEEPIDGSDSQIFGPQFEK